MKHPIPWLRVLLEGVVIVGSILLAFAIDAWWEGRQEHVEERANLVSLQAEFLDARRTADEVVAAGHASIAAATTIASMSTATVHDVAPDSAVSLLGRLFGNLTFDPSTGVLESLLASGTLSRFSNLELIRELGAWSGGLADLEEERRLVLEPYERFLEDLVRLELASRLLSTPFAEDAAFGHEFLVAVVTDGRAKEWIAASGSAQQAYLGEFASVSARIDEILELIEPELSR